MKISELARERLGFERLRPGQEQAVAAAAAGRDVLAVLPTGGGKSAIYELAGLLRGGPTVVVSPLIALQDDQLAHLRAAGLPATVLNSAQSAGARAAALVEACGPDEFVFVSPEQLANDETRAALQRARPGLFVVDEAHLVSQWGRDFRPDYLRLGAQADELGAGVRIALTATAAPPVRREICRRLGLRDPEVVIGDFDRPHIDLSVQHARSPEDKQRLIAQAVDELGGSGIVYAATHAGAEAARDTLAAAGERVTLYHAGLGAAARRRAMAEFLDGSARIVAATVAFGMGVDKPDVRWVLHADAPVSLDAYYQELGRAGRDGERAEARLLYRPEDIGAARHLTARGVSEAVVAEVAEELAAAGVGELRLPLGDAGAGTAGRRRRGRVGGRRAGALDRGDGCRRRARRIARGGRARARGRALSAGDDAPLRRAHRVPALVPALLLRAGLPRPVRRVRQRPPARAAPPPAVEPFPVGGRVASDRWGEGTVQRYDGDQVTVLFDDHGYRDLLVPLVVERGLLRAR